MGKESILSQPPIRETIIGTFLGWVVRCLTGWHEALAIGAIGGFITGLVRATTDRSPA